MDKFIYLMPGNWFTLQNVNPHKLCPFDQEMIQNEILEQICNRDDNLSFINLTFEQSYKNSVIESIDFYLGKKLDLMASLMPSEKFHPIMTFHGTSSKQVVDSILENGYILPEKDKVAHGSAYGVGVYSSPFFNKCTYYTTPDNMKYIYLLVNMVFLGKMKMISPQVKAVPRPTNGVFGDGYDTRVLYGLDQLVSADPKRVVPLGVISIKV